MENRVMFSAIIKFALSQRLLVALLVLLMGGYGLYAYRHLPIDAFPDVSSPQVKIVVKVPGMTPEEMEARVLAPIEMEMLGIPGETMLRSMAKYGLADITLNFEDGTDVYWARQQVNERLSGVWNNLPPGITGGMAPITTPLGEMFMFTIEGKQLSLEEKRSLLDWVIRPQLRAVPGVADVNALGGLARTFEVIPDPYALAAHGLTLSDVAQALSSNNRDDGAGRLKDGEEALLVRSLGQIQTLEDVRAIAIAQSNGAPIRVGDIARVRIGAITR
jgi:cobalt-zinc-cadmium resistance protein CzcA